MEQTCVYHTRMQGCVSGIVTRPRVSAFRAFSTILSKRSEFPGSSFSHHLCFHAHLVRLQGTLLPRRTTTTTRITAAAAASAQGQGTAAANTQQPVAPPEVDVKFIAIGTRGAAALQKLMASSPIPNAELWCLDVDPKVLESVPFAKGQLVHKESSSDSGDGPLPPDVLLSVVGRTASDATGRGNIGSADGGVAFVLGPAAAGPGGSGLVVQLTKALRAAGHFTVAAVTSPFEFEGAAKKEQARALVAELEEQAHLVAVMEQDVLLQAFGESQLTVSEATDIADSALEHTARSVLHAVQAQEILKSSRGALMWHGRDLRHYKRLLSPPLQQLLTCPGTAVLGRGLASLPADAAHTMGASKALMHLASDAVLAAAESPFLDGVLDSASAVLCCVNLPPVEQAFAQKNGEMAVLSAIQTPEGERQATRMAAQAAAGALRSITGRTCDDFVLCVEPRPLSEARGDGSALQVEATLLVLRSPSAGGAAQQPLTTRTVLPAVGQQPGPPPGTPMRAPQQQQQQQQQQSASGGKVPSGRLPASTWSMLSAMAGGGKVGDTPQDTKETPTTTPPPPPPVPVVASQRPAAPVPVARPAASSVPPPSASPFQGKVPPPASTPAPTSTPAVSQQLPQEASVNEDTAGVSAIEERVTVGDYLAESLTAQSLDLPPAAAKWRQAQRVEKLRQRRLIVWEVDETEPWEEKEEEPKGIASFLRRGGRAPKRQVNIRDRVAGMLAQDRDDTWDREQ